MNPQPQNFVEGERVWLRARGYNVPLHGDGVGTEIEVVTGLSHTARLDSGLLGWNGSLMVPNAGQMGERYLPGLQEVKK